MLFTSTALFITTCVLGREKTLVSDVKETGWLQRSREALPPICEHPFPTAVPLVLNPGLWAVLVLLATSWVVFSLFW